MIRSVFKILTAAVIITVSSCTSSDIIVADFESGNFEGWTVEGTAFGTSPATGAVDVQMPVSGFQGKYFANSFHGGDDAVGTITSPEFTIERNFINFLLGGGKHSEIYVELIVDGKSVYVSRPTLESETLECLTWNVKTYKGKKAKIRVVDNQKGGWGHILLDEIVMSNEAKSNIIHNCELTFKIDKKYLLIPIEDQGPELITYLKKGDKDLILPFTVRVAQSRTDYWIPIDVQQYKGDNISIVFDNINKNSIGYSQIKQSDDFHFDYNETYRPNYHFSPQYGWTNDPNGMVYYNGEYHLFYQHNPYGTMWGNMHWGHTVSKDLKKWEHLPVAISPDLLGAVFSGSVVVDKENTAGFGANALVALYTSAGKKQTQSIAYSTDNGRTFTKYDRNPVLTDDNYPDFRDPKVFWHDATKQWVMSLATGQTITFYGSPNLKEWNRLSEFGTGMGAHGGVWECPDMFPLAYNGQTKWVLLVSINPGGPNGGSATQYFIGGFDGKTFKADNLPYPLWLDYGRDNYAGVTWNNAPDNRRLFIGWMSNWDYTNQVPSINFRNAMTLPRELSIVHNGEHLIVAGKPVAETDDMKSNKKSIGNISVDKDHIINKLSENGNGSYEIEMTIVPGKSSGFDFRLSNRKGEELKFSFDLRKMTLEADRSKSGLVDFNDKFASDPIKAPIPKSENYNIRLFVDKASAEIFINDGKVVMTNTVFPTEAYNTLHINSKDDGSISVRNFNIYNIK